MPLTGMIDIGVNENIVGILLTNFHRIIDRIVKQLNLKLVLGIVDFCNGVQ